MDFKKLLVFRHTAQLLDPKIIDIRQSDMSPMWSHFFNEHDVNCGYNAHNPQPFYIDIKQNINVNAQYFVNPLTAVKKQLNIKSND